MSWKRIPFHNLWRIPAKNGLTKPSRIRGQGYKMINMGELFANDRIYDIEMELVPLSESEKENNKIEPLDLLFARQSLVLEGAGKCSIVMDASPLTVFESHLIRVRLSQQLADPRFYYYYFRSGVSGIKNIVSQGVQAGIRGSDLSELSVIFPPLAEQRRIADILSAYDDLIENNRKQIKLLEEAARRLYKEWFIDLHFPGCEHTEIINGIPEGWKKEKVGNLISKRHKHQSVQTSEYKENGKIPIIDQSRDFIAGYTDNTDSIINDLPTIIFGDHTRILKLIQFPFVQGADGTQIIQSACQQMPERLFYCSLLNIDLSNYHYARHFKFLKNEEILVPDDETAKHFELFGKSIFGKVQLCRDEIRDLTNNRDILLPKLMNGEMVIPL